MSRQLSTGRRRYRLSWRRSTRAFIIAVTLLTIVIVALVRHHEGGTSSVPTPTPTHAPSATP